MTHNDGQSSLFLGHFFFEDSFLFPRMLFIWWAPAVFDSFRVLKACKSP